MFCSNCGQKLVDGSRFCSSCGARVQMAEPRQTVQEAPRPAAAAWQRVPPEAPSPSEAGAGRGRILLEYDLWWQLYKYANGKTYGVSMADGKKITICDDRIILHVSYAGSANYQYFGLVGLGVRKAKAKKIPEIVYPFDRIANIYEREGKAVNGKPETWLAVELRSGEGVLITTGIKEKGLTLGNAAAEVRRIVETVKPCLDRY